MLLINDKVLYCTVIMIIDIKMTFIFMPASCDVTAILHMHFCACFVMIMITLPS